MAIKCDDSTDDSLVLRSCPPSHEIYPKLILSMKRFYKWKELLDVDGSESLAGDSFMRG